MSKPARKNLRIAVQADPLQSLKPDIDNTLALMRAALRRGYAVFFYEPKDLRWRNEGDQAGLWAHGAWVQDWPEAAPLPQMGATEAINLGDCDVLLLRQDPPFDMAYITSTYLLEHIMDRVLVVNDPRMVRNAPEKLFITHFPDLQPPTLISADAGAIDAFRAQYGVIVLKPLYSFGGNGVVRVAPEAGSAVIENYLAHQNGLPCIAQQFIPAIAAGDKRVVLINGVIAGAYRRVPKAGDFRASVRLAGATLESATVTPREKSMIDRFARKLVEQGILFAGIDVIDTYVSEINITSPTGLLGVNKLNNLTGAQRCEEKFWDAVEQRLVLRKL